MEAKPSEALAEYKRLRGIMKQEMPEVMKNLAFRRFSCGSGGGGEECCEGAGNFA
jgi:hypothetical protein